MSNMEACWSLFLLVEIFVTVYILCEFLSTANMKIIYTASNTFCLFEFGSGHYQCVFVLFFQEKTKRSKSFQEKEKIKSDF